MKISKLIEKLESLKVEHGNLECFDNHFHQLDEFDILVEDKDGWPKKWKMPKKFIVIGTD